MQRALLVVVVLDSLGALLVGIGLYFVYAAGGDVSGGSQENRNGAFYAIAVGAAIMLWSMIKMVSLMRRKARLKRDQDG
ncbi:MAG: hypothetical protein QNJ85_15150 [Gammaproteobacteria bacterium]|nr:hypothetical protein [Gammaproteobacteria bacterium]